MAKNKDFKFYMDQLKSAQCHCEMPKKPGRSFCFSCFKMLPTELRNPLYQPIGDGYEDAYEEAVRYLT